MSDLLNNKRSSNYENTMINASDRYEVLPDYSLRVKGTIHSKAHAIKEIGLYENINDVLDEALDKLIDSNSKDFQAKVKEEITRYNENKLRRTKKTNKNKKK